MSGKIRHDFDKLNRLPPYVLAEVIEMMKSARRAGEDIVDLGMGNPGHGDAPARDREDLRGGAQPEEPPLLGVARHPEPARRDLRVVPAAPRRRARPGDGGDRRDRREGGAVPLRADDDRAGRRGAVSGSRVPDPPVLGDHRRRRPAPRAAQRRRGLHREPGAGDPPHLAQAQDADHLVPGEPEHPGGGSRRSSSGSSPSRARTT